MNHLEQFERRLLQDALTTATARYWKQRAAVFEAAKPRPGDYPGQATEADLREAWQRCDAAAKACLARAKCVPFDEVTDEVVAAIREAA